MPNFSVTLDTTLSGENSNSYVDLATADSYFVSHWNSTASNAWSNLSDLQKNMLLMQACRVIDTLRFTNESTRNDYDMRYSMLTRLVMTFPREWEPIRMYWYQRLQFPRNIDIQRSTSGPGTVGQPFIPDPVGFAQCEQAVYLLSFDSTAMSNAIQGVTLDKVSIGKGDIATTQEYTPGGSSYSWMALEFLRPYIIKNKRVRRS